MKVDLKVEYCDHRAAEWAVKNWHYSKSMPTPPVIKIGVWENGKFIGCVLFSRGANNNIGKTYNLKVTEIAELTRVALTGHISSVSQIVSFAVKILRQKEKGLRLLVSYADPNNNHHGGIYQAMNWIYVGKGGPDSRLLMPSGKLLHSRQFSVNGLRTQYRTLRRVPTPRDGKLIKIEGKHKYLYPLDRAMRRQIAPLAKPYPKRESMRLTDGSTLTHQLGGGDSTSTQPLTLTGHKALPVPPGETPRRVSG